jgi:hypothetical protein
MNASEISDIDNNNIAMNKLVSAEELLIILWSTKSRPSLRWLRLQTTQRTIPSIKSAGRRWYVPQEVLDHMRQNKRKLGRPFKNGP